MKVIRVAATGIIDDAIQQTGYVPHDGSFGITDADELAEAAGRLCYKSFQRPNPKTATNVGYLKNIINQEHFSVLEHASVTYYVSGVSRSLLTELERHRHFSLSVVSQRYVSHSDTYVNKNYVYPPVFQELDAYQSMDLKREVDELIVIIDYVYEVIVNTLTEAGLSRKEIREAARSVLPQAVTTEFFITGNLRAYREMLQKRLSPGADKEIRYLAKELLQDLKQYAPNTFQDLNEMDD